MLVYDHGPLTLNDTYEYERIRYACPSLFEPSLTNIGTYDVILKEGQTGPLNNLFPKTYVNEAGKYAIANYIMTLDFVEDVQIGEYLKLTLTYQGTPVVGAEVRCYYAGTPFMLLPSYLTDNQGEVKLYLIKGSYDLLIKYTMDMNPPKAFGKFYCSTVEMYKNFTRYITNIELLSGIKPFDLMTTTDRLPIVRFMRRVNGSANAANRQGNLLDINSVRYDKNSAFAPNVFADGMSRLYDEDGNIIQVVSIDHEGRSMIWAEQGKKYILFHDQVGFDTIYEVLDTTYLLGGKIAGTPVTPSILVEAQPGSTAEVQVMTVESSDSDLRTIFNYKNEIGDQPSAFHLQLLDMVDLNNPLYEDMSLAFQASYASSLSDLSVSAMSFMSFNSAMSWQQQLWYYQNIPKMSAMSATSYQMQIRGRNIDGEWGDWGVSQFTIVEP